MATKASSQSFKLKPLWRIRRPILSVVLSCLVVAAMLWGSLLAPRTFEVSGQWVSHHEPLLSQIDHPPLHQLTATSFTQIQSDPSNIRLTLLTSSKVGLLVYTTALDSKQAVDQVNDWMAHRAEQLTKKLKQQLDELSSMHQSRMDADQPTLDQLTRQINQAQIQLANHTLVSSGQLAKQLNESELALEQLSRQQAVYMGANRTLKGLLARKKLLEQDLVMHQQRYGREDNDPAVKLVNDQLAKLNVRIDITSKSSKLDHQADAKLAAVSQQIDKQKQAIALLKAKQKQLDEHAAAKALIAKIQPQQHALSNRLAYHQKQHAFIDNALAGKVAWGHQQRATLEQTRVIKPTLKHIVLIALGVGFFSLILFQLIFRGLDQTLDRGMMLEDYLGMPVLGEITFNKQVGFLRWTKRMTVYPLIATSIMLILAVSLGVVYIHLHSIIPAPGSPGSSAVFINLFRQQTDDKIEKQPVKPQTIPVVIELKPIPTKQLSGKGS